MKTEDRARMIFDNEVDPALEELEVDFNSREGYKIQSGHLPLMGIRETEHNGFRVTKPNGNTFSISVNWIKNSDRFAIAIDGAEAGTYLMMEVIKEALKRDITRLIEQY